MARFADHHSLTVYIRFHSAFAATHALEDRMMLMPGFATTAELTHAIFLSGASKEGVWNDHENITS
jgi:hypothetical protein